MSNALVQRMVVVYGAPDTVDPQRFIAEFERVLKGYAVSELDKAGDMLLKVRKRWPSIAECVNACEDARASLGHRPKLQPLNSHEGAVRLALESELAREAATDGWVLGLRDFVARTGKLPRAGEIAKIKADSSFTERCAGGDVHMGVQHHALERLAISLCEKNLALATKVLASN